jgi:exopolysaccharide biosynthesis polyprenyl glycosylphosphotransferase
MIQDRAKGVVACRQVVELAVAQCVYWGTYWFAAFGTSGGMQGVRYAKYSVAILAGMLVHNVWTNERFATLTRTGWIQNHRQASRLAIAVAISLFSLCGVLGETGVSRAFLLLVPLLLYPAVLVTNRWLIRPVTAFLYSSKRDFTLALGNATESTEWTTWLKDQRELGLRVVGVDQLLASMDREPTPHGFPIMETLKQIADLQPVTQLLLLELPQDRNYLRELAIFCNQKGIRMLIIHDLHKQIGHSISFFCHNGIHLVSLRKEPLENPMNRLLKRAFDIVFSIIMLLVVMPLLIPIVWLLQRFQSPGSLFFFQTRSGLYNGRFRMVKFRTMHPDHGQESKQVCDGDSRLFSAGSILRKFSIDEIPQFWNVLKGEMSVVGPRPHLGEHNQAFEKILVNYNVRTLVLPGITGLAQIRGFRGETSGVESIQARVASDIYYIENWSFVLDLLIVAKTVLHVISPPPSAK